MASSLMSLEQTQLKDSWIFFSPQENVIAEHQQVETPELWFVDLGWRGILPSAS